MSEVVTRRKMARTLFLTPFGLLFASLVVGIRKIYYGQSSGPAPVRIAAVNDLDVGAYRLFRYPTGDDPCILLRLSSDRFVAFSQNCTHLSCPVHLKTETMQFACPCHQGFFSAEDGRPVAGPPRKALASIAISVRDGHVWAHTKL